MSSIGCGFAYRWMTRFSVLGQDTKRRRELTKLRRQWFAKRKGIVALLRETIFQQESPLVDSDAAQQGGRCRCGAAGTGQR